MHGRYRGRSDRILVTSLSNGPQGTCDALFIIRDDRWTKAGDTCRPQSPYEGHNRFRRGIRIVDVISAEAVDLVIYETRGKPRQSVPLADRFHASYALALYDHLYRLLRDRQPTADTYRHR